MAFAMDAAAMVRLQSFFEDTIGRHLRRPEQRASFAGYAFGLLGEGERKSVEPLAARLCGSPERCRAVHEQLLHFVSKSPWSDNEVRCSSARYVVQAMQERERPTTLIIDDTGFLKQGSHSVGVQRQYTGSAGKVTNCQIGVSLCLATRTAHVPIDFELYLPESWTNDPERREKSRIPESIEFKTKPELALGMIERALANGLPGEILLADSGFGDSCAFRNRVRELGLDYGVGIHGPTMVWRLDAAGRRQGDATAAEQLAIALGRGAFRRITWREGTSKKLASRFCFRRVKVAHNDGTEAKDREAVWLVMEWPEGEPSPTKFHLTTLPRRMSKKEIVRTLKERWRTEMAYQELKGELGLDHFEGRSFPGWHHHVSVVLCCYAFLIAERVRHFPPSRVRQDRDGAIQRAA